MPIEIRCSCTANLRVRDDLAGREIQCPKCSAIHDVPGEIEEPPIDTQTVLKQSDLSESERKRLERELEEGERVLWAAKPDVKAPMLLGLIGSAGCAVFALVLAAIGILSTLGGLGYAGLVLLLPAIALIALGVAIPIQNRRRYQRTAYALTDRRALSWDCDWFAKNRFKDYGPEDVASCRKLQFSQRPGAVGHIFFARETMKTVGHAKFTRTHGFLYIADAASVEKLLREHLIDAYTDRVLT